jgi:RNA polymerase sigma-70 factor (ECF subfamily)
LLRPATVVVVLPAMAAAWDNVVCQRTAMSNSGKPETNQRELFEQTIVPHLNAAYNLARWLTRNQHDAEDLVQEAYLRAFRFFGSFHGGDGRAWLLSVVRNTCLTWLSKKTGGASAAVEFNEQVHGSASPLPDAENAMIRDSRIDSLRGCVEALPVEYREIIVLRELEELSYRQISEIAGVPIGTVMSRLSRGRERLLDCMEAKS